VACWCGAFGLTVLRDGYGLVRNARLMKRPSELGERPGSSYGEKEQQSAVSFGGRPSLFVSLNGRPLGDAKIMGSPELERRNPFANCKPSLSYVVT